MKKKHLVFVLGTFYPSHSANGLCIQKIIPSLIKKYKITLICFKTEKHLPTIEEKDDLTIIRIEDWEMKKRNSIKYNLQNNNNKSVDIYNLMLLRAIQIQKYLKMILAKQTINKIVVEKYINELRKIETPIDVLVPVCFPFESIIATLKYKKAHNESVKVIPYLFDKYSASETAHRNVWNKKIKMNNHLKLEKKMLEKSNYILCSMDWEPHFKQYFMEYMDKVEVTDIPVLVPLISQASINYDNDKINFAYTGALNKKNRNPKYTLEIISRCMEKEPECIFHIYTSGDCDSIIHHYSKMKPGQIINHGSVPVEVAHSAIKNADFLISVGNKDITQTPSKIYEYMASGKPIVHFYQSIEDPVISILAQYSKSCCVKQSEMHSKENIKTIVEFITINYNTPVIPFEEVKKQFFKATPEYSSEILNRAINI